MSAKNREPVKPVESESESGEDDEEVSTEEESDSEPEPTQTQTQTQKNSIKTQHTPAAKPTPTPQPPPSSSEEEESGSESESESEEQESKLKVVPSKNGRSKPNASVPATPTKPVAAKRPSEASTPKDAKKIKTNEPETSGKKSNSFQRLFTDDDEIVILQGMHDFKSERKSDPGVDKAAFHEYIKKKLHTDFTKDQLQTKVRRLKKKFATNTGKEKAGKLVFTNPHEEKAYDLSKSFWKDVDENGVEGSSKAGGVARKTPTKKSKSKVNGTASESEGVKTVKNAAAVGAENVMNAVAVGVENVKNVPKKLKSDAGASMEEMMLKTGRELYEAGEGIEGENEWRKLRVEELQLYVKQLEVRAAQAKLVLDVIRPQDH